MRSFSMQSRLLSLSLLLLTMTCLCCFDPHFKCVHRKFEWIVHWLRVQQFCLLLRNFFFFFFFFCCRSVYVFFFVHFNSRYWRICMVSQCTQIICKILHKQIHDQRKKKKQLYVLNANHFSVFPVNCRSRFLFRPNWWTKM